MRKFLLIATALLLPLLTLTAQEEETDAKTSDDFGLWTSIEGSKKLSKKWTVGAEAEYRLRDDLGTSDRFSVGVSADYKLHKYLTASLGYTFLYDNTPEKQKLRASDQSVKWIRQAFWQPRHRAMASVTGEYDLGRWNFSLRERYQMTYRAAHMTTRDYYTKSGEYNYSEQVNRASKYNNVLRSRLEVSYSIRKCPVTPFLGIEFTNDFDGFALDKTRYEAGADWKINKTNKLSFSYIYQDVRADDGDDDTNSHIISLSFKHKF